MKNFRFLIFGIAAVAFMAAGTQSAIAQNTGKAKKVQKSEQKAVQKGKETQTVAAEHKHEHDGMHKAGASDEKHATCAKMGACKKGGPAAVANIKSTAKFDIIRVKSAWITGINPAGLVNIPVADNVNISYAEANYKLNDGNYVKYYESSNSYQFDFKTESFARVKKVALYGLLEYNTFRGHNMTYSGVVDPERLTNFTADTTGSSKRRENYIVAGGAAFNATKWMQLGVSARINTSNMAKMRDLRHETNYSHIEFNAGAKFVTKFADFGVSYFYQKYNEDVKFSQVGDESSVYGGYWFKGLFFGLTGVWDADNLYMASTAQYFIDKYNGAAGQLEFKYDDPSGAKWRFYNEFAYTKRRGQTGQGGTRIYSKSTGKEYAYTGRISYAKGKFADYLTVKTDYSKINNRDKVFTTQVINGTTEVVYYGENKVFSKRDFSWNIDYIATVGGNTSKRILNPSWFFNAGYSNYSNHSNSSFILPFYFTQKIKYNEVYFNIKKNFMGENGMFDVRAGAKWSNGYGDKLTEHVADNIDATVSEGGKPSPYYKLLDREYEYYTAPRGTYNIGARYSHFLKKKIKGNIYFDADFSYIKGKDIVYAAGDNAIVFSLAVGLAF